MKKKILWSLVVVISLLLVGGAGTGYAVVTGACVNCHTMHNSQDGGVMATFASEEGPNNALTRGSCLGCHGQDISAGEEIINETPQIWHNGATDLAGGNFAYIEGGKGITTGTTMTVGHNVKELSVTDTNLTAPPGDEHINTGLTNLTFTCGGIYGCHGDRTAADSYAAVSGGHHGGVGGICDGSDVANSYRFLLGVKGYENMHATHKYQNVDSVYHNEYFGIGGASETSSSATVASNGTISGLCAECHGDFHGTTGIGGDAISAFERHPTDIVLPNTEGKEYSAYTSYSVQAPVARPSGSGALDVINTSGTNTEVTPGADIVMCLSCHGAHATAYEDILRWDYTQMLAGGGGNDGQGCFVCHTTKD